MGRIRIGTAGWTIPRVHADAAPTLGSHLERYARVFSCAEINSTFYRSSRASTWARWKSSVPDGFRFAVKAPKAITHEAALELTPVVLSALASFLVEACSLGSKLGPILVQLPPKLLFKPARAAAFFAHLRTVHQGPVVVEPRHASWFTAIAELLLATYDVARAAADPPCVPEGTHPGGSPSLLYYRLHGSPRTYYSSYSPEYLDTLVASIAMTANTADVWVIFDNTASGAAFGNALTLTQRNAPRVGCLAATSDAMVP